MNLIMTREIISYEKLNKLFMQVMQEAQSIGVPISRNISAIKINRRAKSRLGCCRQEKKPFGAGSYTIEISERVLAADEKIIRQIIAHELLHTCRGCMNHADTWKKYAEAMNRSFGYNIKRTSSGEELGLEPAERKIREDEEYRYILICQQCGAEIKRKKRCKVVDNPAHYRCGKCGGTLKLM